MSNFWAVKKESTDFGKKCGLGGGLKKCGEKCAAKSWASKTHLQKVWTFFSMIENVLDPQKLKMKIKD